MSDPSFGGPSGGGWPPSESLTVVTGAGGPQPTRNSVFPGRTWTIGRAAEADFVVTGEHVSRHHLVLEHDQQDWLVRDVSSTGSWHNGNRIGPEGIRPQRGGPLLLNLGDHTGPQVLLERPPAEPVHAYGPANAGAPGPKPKRRRRGRRIGITLLVLILLLAIADRVGAHVASTQAMSKIVQQSEGLVSRPTVSFGGFPFLTQVVLGKYTDISVGIHDVKLPGPLRVDSISGHLQGAHVPLSTVLNGTVSKVPVDHVAATVAVRFADLNLFLAKQPGHLQLAAGQDGAIQVKGSIVQDGETIKVSGAAKLETNDGGLVVTPTKVHVTGGGDLGDLLGDASDVLGDLLSVFPSVPVPLPDLPFNLRLTSVHSDSNEVVASATADHVVLDPGNS